MPPLNIEQLAKRLGKARRNGKGWVCCCPAHDDCNPSLSLSWNDKTQKLLVRCFAECDYKDVMVAIRQKGYHLSKNFETASQSSTSTYTSHAERARRIWLQTESAQGTVVEKYLCSRGYRGSILPSIRHHPNLYHAPSQTCFPAMIARVEWWPCTNSCSIHRTYLSKDGLGKATVQPDKMMLGSVMGGAVRLTPPGQTLYLTEGIENALTAYFISGKPTWACLSANGLASIILPPIEITQNIVIVADNDDSGMAAASKLAKRLVQTGYKVSIVITPPGKDLNDLLLEGVV